MSNKLKRCAAKGCRTLTAGGELCDVHGAPPEPAAVPAKPAWQWQTSGADDALLDELDGEIAAARARAALRADLEALADAGEKLFGRLARPTFAAEEHDHG